MKELTGTIIRLNTENGPGQQRLGGEDFLFPIPYPISFFFEWMSFPIKFGSSRNSRISFVARRVTLFVSPCCANTEVPTTSG